MKKLQILSLFFVFSSLTLMPVISSATQVAVPAPSTYGSSDPRTNDQLVEDWRKARDAKDWALALQILEEMDKRGEWGRSQARVFRLSTYVKSGDKANTEKLLKSFLIDFVYFQELYMGYTKGKPAENQKMLDDMTAWLYSAINNTKLAKLQGMVQDDQSQLYTAFVNDLMKTDNHFLINKAAWFIVCPDTVKEANEFNPFYLHLPHSAAFQTKDMLQLAKTAVELAIKLEGKDNPDYYDTLGWTYYRLGEIDKAIAAAKKAAEKKPAYAPVAEWFAKQKK